MYRVLRTGSLLLVLGGALAACDGDGEGTVDAETVTNWFDGNNFPDAPEPPPDAFVPPDTIGNVFPDAPEPPPDADDDGDARPAD